MYVYFLINSVIYVTLLIILTQFTEELVQKSQQIIINQVVLFCVCYTCIHDLHGNGSKAIETCRSAIFPGSLLENTGKNLKSKAQNTGNVTYYSKFISSFLSALSFKTNWEQNTLFSRNKGWKMSHSQWKLVYPSYRIGTY